MREMEDERQESADGLKREQGRLSRVLARISGRGDNSLLQQMAQILHQVDKLSPDEQ